MIFINNHCCLSKTALIKKNLNNMNESFLNILSVFIFKFTV
jgi:hypothetical protein